MRVSQSTSRSDWGGRAPDFLDILRFEPPHGGRVIGNYLVNYESRAKGGTAYKSSFAVYIYEIEGSALYLVKEPYLEPRVRAAVASAIESLSVWLAPSPIMEIDPIGYLLAELKRVGLNTMTSEEVQNATHFLVRDIIGYSLLDPVIRDPDIEDISCDGISRPLKVWHRRFNSKGWLETNISFPNREKLDAIVTRLVHRSGRSVSTLSPIVDSVLPEGYRLAATWGHEVTTMGSSFNIRKQRVEPFTLSELVKVGTINSRAAAYLWLLLELKGFVVIAGVSASGKTTLLNSLAAVLNPSWKVLSIEDTREISLPHSGWKPLHTRNTLPRGTNITLFDLVKLSLRERSDFVILGEARGQEVQALFQSAASGSGCVTTFHAPNVESLVARLTEPPLSVSRSLLTLIDAIVFMVRSPDGRRFVSDIVEMHDPPTYLFRHTDGGCEGAPELSQKLEARGQGLGYSRRRMANELLLRTEFLERLVSLGTENPAVFSSELRKFYRSSV